MASRPQAIPELDVLDGRPGESSGVESPDLVEHRAPDGPASCPECRRVGVAPLVHEVVKEVPVSGDHATATRPRVVRAEDGRVLGMVGEEALNALDRSRGGGGGSWPPATPSLRYLPLRSPGFRGRPPGPSA